MENDLIHLRALVVDDSRVMRNMVMKSLQGANLADFEFTEAGSGAEAMDVFDADKHEIIFVDWNMPGMNGIEFAKQLRSMSWASHIPVVMITSESGEGKQQDAFDMARITCYITKPFTVAELHAKIEPIIEKLRKKHEEQGKSAQTPSANNQGGFFSKLLT